MGDKAAAILPEMVSNLLAPAYLFTAVLGIGGALALYYIFKYNELGNAINSIAVSMLAMIFLFSFSMPAVNGEIGLKKGCEEAMEVAKARNITSFAYYKFKTGDNLDVYLNQSVKQLEETHFQQNAQTEQADAKLADGQPAGGQQTDAQQADGQQTDAKHADAQQADAQQGIEHQ